MNEKTECPTFSSIADVFSEMDKVLEYANLIPLTWSVKYKNKSESEIRVSMYNNGKIRHSVTNNMILDITSNKIKTMTDYNTFVNAVMDMFEFDFEKHVSNDYISFSKQDDFRKITIYAHHGFDLDTLSKIAGCELVSQTTMCPITTVSCKVKSQ